MPCWKLKADACGVQVQELYVEYKNVLGDSTLIAKEKPNNTTLYTLTHTYGKLRYFPENICSFDESLVEVDLSNNYITDIGEIKCLKILDSLKLDQNKIVSIPNDTFTMMVNLRYLSMKSNNFLNLQANAIALKKGNIFTVDLSYNLFDKVDVTNILRTGEFCQLKYVGSEIENQTNTDNYTVTDKKYGPGKIDFTGSKGETWLNFSSLGLEHISEFGKHFDLALLWDNSSVHCDCNIVPFLRDLGKSASKYWPSLEDSDFICISPEKMRGASLTNIYHSEDYTNLTCNLQDCPDGCTCTDEQFIQKVTVRCRGLTKFPDYMPIGYWGNTDIELDIEDNDITELPDRDYFSRVSVLKLKGNVLTHLHERAIDKMKKEVVVDITDQKLQRLPITFYNLRPDRINFGNNSVQCECDNLWIGDWIRLKSTNASKTYLTCSTKNGIVDASLVTAGFLDCQQTTPDLMPIIWSMVAMIATLFIIGVGVYHFQYEILLLKRRAMYKRHENALNTNKYMYDVFISMSEDNSEVSEWVKKFLHPRLCKEYSCYMPAFDIMFGDIRDRETEVAIKESLNFVVVLCNKYLQDCGSCHEFETIWKYFSMDTGRQIIIINYIPVETFEILDKRLRAFTRLNLDLNFKDRKTKLYDRLKKKIGGV